MKFIKKIVLTFFIMLAFTSVASAKSNIYEQPTDSIKTVNIKVKGITCSMDLKSISDNVEKVVGVKSCKVGKKGTTASFIVKYNPSIASESAIHTAIESTSGCENPDDRPYKVKK